MNMAPWPTLNRWFILNSLDIRNETSHKHGRRKFFSRGSHKGICPIFLQGVAKVVKFLFSQFKLRKQPFLLKFSKSRGVKAPCPPSDAHGHNETNKKRRRWSYLATLTLHIYWAPRWPRAIWKVKSGVLFHTLYVTITNSQRHKKRMLIVIHFYLSRSFFYRDLVLAA